jgi:two-component system response regulator YesN
MIMERQKRSVSTRTLLYLVIFGLLVVITLLSSIISYISSKSVITSEVETKNDTIITMLSQEVDGLLYRADEVKRQLYKDGKLGSLSRNTLSLDVYRDIELLKDMVTFQDNLKSLHPFINDITVYSTKNHVSVSSREINTLDETTVALVESYLDTSSPVRWFLNGEALPFDTQGRTDSMRQVDITQNFSFPGTIIVVDIDEQAFERQLKDIVVTQSSYVCVYDQEDELLFSSDEAFTHALQSASVVPGELLPDGGSISIDGQPYLYTSRSSGLNNLHYVIFTSERAMYASLATMRNTTLLVFGLLIILITLLSLEASRRFYQPIARIKGLLPVQAGDNEANDVDTITSKITGMLSQLSTQQKEIEQYSHAQATGQQYIASLTEYFICNVMMGSLCDQEEITRQSNFLHMPTNAHYMVLAIVFTDCTLTNEQNATAFKTQLSNLFEKIIGEEALFRKVLYQAPDDQVQLLCVIAYPLSYPEELCENKLRVASGFFQHLLSTQFGISTFASLSSVKETLPDLQRCSAEAVSALRYAFIAGEDGMITQSDLLKAKNLSLKIIPDKTDFRRSLQKATIQDVDSLMDTYVSVITSKAQSIEYVYYCKDILNALYQFATSKGCPQSITTDIMEKFISFQESFKMFDEFQHWARETLLATIPFSVLDRQSENQLVSMAVRFIDGHYHKDISLTDVADFLGVSESYLSRLFKDVLHINFKPYLTERKMEEAMRLLKTTRMTIKEISQSVGYNNAKQFSLIFRKRFGSNPNEIRREDWETDHP